MVLATLVLEAVSTLVRAGALIPALAEVLTLDLAAAYTPVQVVAPTQVLVVAYTPALAAALILDRAEVLIRDPAGAPTLAPVVVVILALAVAAPTNGTVLILTAIRRQTERRNTAPFSIALVTE